MSIFYNTDSTCGSANDYYNVRRDWSNTSRWLECMSRPIEKCKPLTRSELKKMCGENPEAKEGKITWVTHP